MLKVGYWLGSGSIQGGGVGPYAWRLLKILLTRSEAFDFKLLILCSQDAASACERLVEQSKATAQICLIPKFNLVRRTLGRSSQEIANILENLSLPSHFIRKLNHWSIWFSSLDIDILHVPYQTLHYYDLPYPLTITMHDVQEKHYPNFFSSQELALRIKCHGTSLQRSTSIVVSFEHVKQDLKNFYSVPTAKVYVCPLPYQEISLSPPSTSKEAFYRKKYASLDGFLLYPAQTWQHKNHLALIQSVRLLKEKFGRHIEVVCTGRKNDFFLEISERMEDYGVTDNFHFLDVVPEDELYWLYHNCSLVVIPTLYEAGSFPLIEAMFFKVPVICSSVTSLPDTIGDQKFVFDPLNIPQMTDLILKMLDEPSIRDANTLNSYDRIQSLIHFDPVSSLVETWHKSLSMFASTCSSKYLSETFN